MQRPPGHTGQNGPQNMRVSRRIGARRAGVGQHRRFQRLVNPVLRGGPGGIGCARAGGEARLHRQKMLDRDAAHPFVGPARDHPGQVLRGGRVKPRQLSPRDRTAHKRRDQRFRHRFHIHRPVEAGASKRLSRNQRAPVIDHNGVQPVDLGRKAQHRRKPRASMGWRGGGGQKPRQHAPPVQPRGSRAAAYREHDTRHRPAQSRPRYRRRNRRPDTPPSRPPLQAWHCRAMAHSGRYA